MKRTKLSWAKELADSLIKNSKNVTNEPHRINYIKGQAEEIRNLLDDINGVFK